MKAINNKLTIKSLAKDAAAATLLLAALNFASCNYLEYDESLGYDSQADVFSSYTYTLQALTDVYSRLPYDFSSIDGAMRDCATDDAHYVWSDGDVYIFNDGRWSAQTTIDDKWSDHYSAIRAANQFLVNFAEADYSIYEWNDGNATNVEKASYWPYEARLLRSIYLFDLARRYGDIPLATDIYTVETVNDLEKTPFADVIAYIVSECTECAANLPLDFSAVTGAETGRVTKGTALALKAKALLYLASPLHSTDSQDKWSAAASAAKEVMDLNIYSLGTIDQVVNDLSSPELIFERREATSNAFEVYNFPISFENGMSGTCPTQNLVDAFQNTSGEDVVLTSSGWSVGGQLVADASFDPYADRDPRFYNTLLYNGAEFKSTTINSYYGGDAGRPTTGASQTGYYLRKYLLDNVSITTAAPTYSIHYYVMFRYAEVLLNYAEAMNEAYGPEATSGSLTKTALAALNDVRTRAGMPAYTSADASDKASFRTLLQREKRIEFAFEDHRFWDVRRWGIGASTQSDINGVTITNNSGVLSYALYDVETRTWADKMNLYPIPITELYINSNLYPQNSGW